MPGAQARRGWVWAAAVLVAGCSGDKAGSHAAGAAGIGASGAGASLAGSGANSSQPGGFGNVTNNTPTTRADASMPVLGTPDCVGKTQMAEQVEVDMYIMLDRSGSMMEMTGAGNTKWDAIRDALSSFVQAPDSSGLGVGLQYFPLQAPGVPESCMVDGDCGSAGGPCSNKACLSPRRGASLPYTPCFTDANCPFTSPGCQSVGFCSGDPMFYCFSLGPNGCQAQGDCVAHPGECANYASCMTADYATPAVPIALLPANASALTASLTAEKAIGLTPTPAALAGAINRAAAHAMQNPSHRVIAVLATDGLPTDCLPANTQTQAQAVTATAMVAAQGLALTTSIETYVIGVFSPDDANAMASLDQLAAAGGTGKAFIVDQSKDVTQQLLDALAMIRGGVLSCELQLPAAPDGKTLDYDFVNVEFTDNGNVHKLFRVTGNDQCTKTDSGWYYDTDPKVAPPTKILVCPRTCDTLKAATNASTEIRLGCPSAPPI